MGRYRQWLRHQEIEQQLQTYLQQLEAELARLQEQATLGSNVKSSISENNQLFIALTANMHIPSQTAIPNTPREELASSLPHPELALQPEDMMAYYDAQSVTEPQRELPRWLHNLIEASLHNNQGISAMNEARLRSNRLFQRWSERWGAPSPASSKASDTVKRQTPRKGGAT